ncbi:hypothetical protein E2320_006551, partial [Naja naja]
PRSGGRGGLPRCWARRPTFAGRCRCRLLREKVDLRRRGWARPPGPSLAGGGADRCKARAAPAGKATASSRRSCQWRLDKRSSSWAGPVLHTPHHHPNPGMVCKSISRHSRQPWTGASPSKTPMPASPFLGLN